MILAGYLRMGFWDFFIYQGRPGIFFAVQAGALASLLVLALLFRRHRTNTATVPQEAARSWTPTGFLILLIIGLSFATLVDPDFKWFAGSFTLALGILAICWFQLLARWGTTRDIVRSLDWDTTLFLAGVFILVGALGDSGWIDRLAGTMAASVGSSKLLAFVVIVGFSMIISGFVDNVPFLLVMIPVAQKLAEQMDTPVPLLMFGLLVGSCLGGNLTPIGASANVVTLGILRKQGHTVGFREFMRVSVPFTLAAVVSACAFVWWVWG
jgi:Na+/H+ antiporter NhaD/arsenite permease-like protein